MLSYEKAKALLESAKDPSKGKPIGNNTRLFWREGGVIAIRLHTTDILLISPEDRYTYNSGGYRTRTTKDRLNEYGPIRIFQEGGIWYWSDYADRSIKAKRPYFEGITICADGRVYGAESLPPDDTEQRKSLQKIIRKYITGFCASIQKEGMKDPTIGDCMSCTFKRTDNLGSHTPGEKDPFGTDHFLYHFREGYYVPSLLWNAFQIFGNPSFVWQLQKGRNQDTSYARQALRTFFRKRFENILKEYKDRWDSICKEVSS